MSSLDTREGATGLASLRAGDDAAWAQFVEEYGGRIFRYFDNNAPEGEDVAALSSQAMEVICQQLPGFRGDASLLTWCYAICRNILVDAHRRRGRFRSFFETYGPFGWLSAAPDPEAAMIHKDEVELMHAALRSLPLKYKEVLTLRYIEEHSIQEVAELLGLSADLVKNRARLGKSYLRKAMERRGLTSFPQAAPMMGPGEPS